MRSSTVAKIAPLAIFIAALIANRRAATAPIAWPDTIYDQTFVDRCLGDGRCTLLGIGTSIPGVFHAVAWLNLRTSLHWLGVGPAGLLWLVQVANALATTIVFHVATRLGGLLAGAAAAAVLVLGIDLGFALDGVHNLSALPFLGAVLTVACVAVVEAPGVAIVALAALVAAVVANVHVVGVLTGVSVTWCALAAQGRRFASALVALTVFGAATVAFAPASWRQNLLAMLVEAPVGHGPTPPAAPALDVAWWTALALAIWLGSLVTRAPWAAARRASIGPLAIVLPTLAAVLAAPSFGIHPEAKYLIAVHAACATAAGLAIGRTAEALIAALHSPATSRVLALLAPYGVAIAVASATLAVEHPDETMTLEDLAAASRVLRTEHGWSAARVVRGFTTPARATALTGLLAHPGEDGPARSEPEGEEDVAALLRIEADAVSDPPPVGWHVVRRSAGSATVLMVGPSPLDWRRFELCVAGPHGAMERCDPVTWEGFDPRRDAVVALPHMPPAGVRWTGAFRLRVPVSDRARRLGGAVFMPRGLSCGGHIVSVHGIGATISDDRRRTTFAGPATEASAAAVELEWQVGSADCDVLQYDGLPPFVVAGDARDVDRLERILRRRERADAARSRS